MTDYGRDVQILQRVVFKPADSRAMPLYLRRDEQSGAWGTDTYFNVFHRRRWTALTGLSDFRLHLTARGVGRLTIEGISRGADGVPVVASQIHLLDSDWIQNYIFELSALEGDFISFFWEATPGHDVQVLRAGYGALRTGRERDVRLALVVTTYYRDRELFELVATYRAARDRHPDLLGSSALFVINNAPDNDLSALARDGVVRVYANSANEGGAGGFARGAHEVVRLGGFTHTVFMDDDASVVPETWLRTVCLLRNFKECHVDDVVAGAMFTTERPTYCHVAREGLDARGHRKLMAGGCEVLSLAAVMALTQDKSNVHDCQAYAAWWYCVIPMTVFARHGFPLPYFFRGDDQEFCLRTGCAVQQLNGICVWHPGFAARKSPLRIYCGARNYMLTQLLHFENWKRNVCDFFWKHVSRVLSSGDYETCAAYVLALHDAMRFEHIPRNGEELIPYVTTSCAAYAGGRSKSATVLGDVGKIRPEKRGWCRFVVFCSLGGALLPLSLLQSIRCFSARLKRIEAAPETGIETTEDAIRYEFSRKKAFSLTTRTLWLLLSLIFWNGHRVRRFLMKSMGINPQSE